MRPIISLRAFCIKAVFMSLIIVALFTATTYSVQGPVKGLRGPAFSDPDKRMEMPAGWQNSPVKYEPAYSDADLVVSLDGQMFDAWEPIIHKYAKQNGLKIYVGKGTCGVSSGDLSKKSVDSGVFCCPPERADRLPGLRFHTLGIAAVALIVHPDNPVDNITFNQAQQIFQGNIRNWSQITGVSKTGKLIQPVGRLHCKSRPGHWRLLLDNKDMFSPDLFEVGAIPDMINKVAINPGAIGHEILWTTRFYKDRGNVKFLKINGYSPANPADVISLRYPIYRVFSFTTWEGKNVETAHARNMVKYLIQEARSLDGKFSFIPSSELRKAGWKFRDTELVGEPD
ncbi:MAG: hypothetical protein HZC49_06975 [Nitrospirae bacterium]|nr:hypothetical protein [Nitrospirota bacterium]